MKKFVFILLVAFTTIGFSQQDERDTNLSWITNVEEAVKISTEEEKPILLYFTGSDWCAPCKMLKEDFFESEAFQQRANDMVLVLIDYPRRMDVISTEQLNYNKTIIAKYNKERTFPKVLMLDSKGKELDRISGYSPLRDTKNHFDFIDQYLK
ncbi:thioredoxin family protein [Luteirhabdus pelagi]|uniref:thioredoxin family protein n=1 Tax=Luteirhabdus pelagi TaxID=2792783 RepID=UPI00193A0D15|nr:thioredoxin family protein [Luteirhabdus pelagi]